MNSPRKIIGLNFISIPHQKAGVGFLAVNLFREVISRQTDLFFILYSTRGLTFEELYFKNSQHKLIAPINSIIKILWEQLFFPKIVKIDKIDVLFNIHCTALLFLNRNTVQITIVPDMTYQRYFFRRKIIKSFFITLFLPLSLVKSKNIIAISEFTKSEILKIFPVIPKKKIIVMYLGLGSLGQTENQNTNQQVLKVLDVSPGKYYLFVGTVEPTKNIYRNLMAFKEIIIKHKDLKFVIVGKRGWQDKKDKRFKLLLKFIKLNGLDDKVVFTGYLENRDLKELYTGALGLVFTSLYEGFGIPILEAMATNIPVLSSNISSMPEVAGDAALLVDPLSVSAIEAGMLRLHEDEIFRESLIKKGRNRLKQFNWSRSAQIVEKIIQSIE